MNHHIYHVLSNWYPRRDEGRWLLATIVSTQGSSYRKAGAMMLFSEQGTQLGVVSGGCLESDILHQARRCWERNVSRIVTYDMQEEGDIAWRLGLGCGGEVTLLLQPISAETDYLSLPNVLSALQNAAPCSYVQPLREGEPKAAVCDSHHPIAGEFVCQVTPPPVLAILGGGVDAIPVSDIATRLGWHVLVNDSRPRYARAKDFTSATQTTALPANAIEQGPWYHKANGVIVMHHHVGMDADSLRTLAKVSPEKLQYLALLGPWHRAERVLDEAGITEQDLPVNLFAPAGLSIGGDLPESIALSMLSQAHGVFHDKPADGLKGKPCR
ncbi:XdhC family protein [Alteromonas sp. C1M14]|uniref:XdhC family protein n=1 Tax=Alteromonas sp. C1M14 TaxID=2841567 RepID=UPI001C0A11C0|nr:XdhC family protein [Alteromonas sp. C1M14]MBU2976769.1 XdhC family protein [Alteromonas sp. C1M14]